MMISKPCPWRQDTYKRYSGKPGAVQYWIFMEGELRRSQPPRMTIRQSRTAKAPIFTDVRNLFLLGVMELAIRRIPLTRNECVLFCANT